MSDTGCSHKDIGPHSTQNMFSRKKQTQQYHLRPTAQPSILKHFTLTFIIFYLVCKLVAIMSLLWGPHTWAFNPRQLYVRTAKQVRCWDHQETCAFVNGNDSSRERQRPKNRSQHPGREQSPTASSLNDLSIKSSSQVRSSPAPVLDSSRTQPHSFITYCL